MNREIKFRAWDKKEKRMRQIVMLETDSACGIDFQAQYYGDKGDHTYRKDIELMQFTGLLDKNGKEIYEGDVLGYDDGGKIKVEWSKPFAGFGPFINDNYAGNPLHCEIIGNIYENPELLKP